MESFPVTFALYAYGVAAVGFALFGLQLIMGARQSPRARLLSVCMLSGAVWCALAAASVLKGYAVLRTLVYAADA
ncbi:MAG: PEP-CTERM system histidine kinase PrsK, partial [Methyloversatilis sp.]|nr:PEP-CTERM system histidine kinase PrsK [Methyloversatilis sp.]